MFLLTSLHVLISVLLVGGILLQPGTKGGSLGSAFGGGGSNSAFGPRGATPFLAKLTYLLAAGFMVTSISIEIFVIRSNRSSLEKAGSARKVQPGAPKKEAPKPAEAPKPTVPATPVQPAGK